MPRRLNIGWQDTPVARRVVSLDSTYYILAQRWRCRGPRVDGMNGGCKVNFTLYDERILRQFPKGLQLTFPGMSTSLSLSAIIIVHPNAIFSQHTLPIGVESTRP